MNGADKPARELSIWRFCDGRPGHDSQSRGLVAALLRRTAGRSYDIAVSPKSTSLWKRLFGGFPVRADLPPPDLLIGAGHATHLPMLHARRRGGGKIVVLMRPSLPLGCFDYCFIPEHDAPPRRDNVFPTCGALNGIRPAGRLDEKRGLILIGGRSRHFHWDGQRLQQQLASLLEKRQKSWIISDSPRTPAETKQALQAIETAEYVPWETCAPGWLAEELGRAATVWVTPDSISMLYEAASAGGRVGVLELAQQRKGRLLRASQRLIEQGRVTPFSAWAQGAALPTGPPALQEAARCAEILMERLGRRGEGAACG